MIPRLPACHLPLAGRRIAATLALALAAAAGAGPVAAQPAAPLPARAAAPGAGSARLAQAQERVNAAQPEDALPLLDAELAQNPKNAEALLLRSTAHFMLGEIDAGKKDLDQALAIDPSLRQGWLNRAGVNLAQKDYGAALTALERAEQLDPQALDNDLNIGAVLLLQGKLKPASDRFARYLERNQGSADAYYLVASNYALVGYAALAVEQLHRAIEIDERSRLRAGTDANFKDLADNPKFQELMAADLYRPPPGAYSDSRTYATPYDAGDNKLLGAVIDAMQRTGKPFDPRVEKTADWAILWGDVRVKVGRTGDGQGLVELSAPPGRFTPAEWKERTDRLFQEIAAELALQR